MVPQIASVEAVVCASVHEAAWLERNLIERSKPRWNRAVGGQEVPRWLVLDPDPTRPGVRLTHEPGAGLLGFGPYLGGDRSRTALRAILRVYPLHLTGERSSATERAMAQARGVGPRDRERLHAEIVQLLGRDPLAGEQIVARLSAARDDAAADLRFETAQQLHEEIAAVAWLVSPQRVTGTQPADLVVHGWAEGVLVSFSGTSTRLDRWDVRRVGESRGRTLAELTPAGWREFAMINAELGARLLPPR
jgi:excinuclease ABC subunit C